MMTNVESLRREMVAAFLDVLASIDAGQACEDALRRAPIRGRAHVVAAGKAAASMLAGSLRALGPNVADACAVTADGGAVAGLPAAVHVLFARHPVPDQRSLEAAEYALNLARSVPASDTLLALVSGGTSALLCCPPPGISFVHKARLTDRLLRSGAPIGDVNLIRRHASGIKGGRLAAACAGQVVCVIVSDVIGGEAHDVGSGPACPDPTTTAQAKEALQRWLGDDARSFEHWLSDGLTPGSADAERVHVQIVLRPEDLGRRIAEHLCRRGMRASAIVEAEVTAEGLAARITSLANTLAPGQAVALTAEPTLPLPRQTGRGGRAGWVALRAMVTRALPDDTVLLCGASDGADGSSGNAGACVAASHAARFDCAKLQEALNAYDDAPAHDAMGTAIRTGPTGQNLTDVYVIARAAR